MQTISKYGLSLTLLLSVAAMSADQKAPFYAPSSAKDVPVIIVNSPYEAKEMHPVVPFIASGVSGTLYGYLAAKTNLGTEAVKAFTSGDPYQMLGASIITAAVIAQSADIRQRILGKKDADNKETLMHMANGVAWSLLAYFNAKK